jgi:hypothetical protein
VLKEVDELLDGVLEVDVVLPEGVVAVDYEVLSQARQRT